MMSRHHVLHEATAWNSRPDAAKLRGEPTLIPRIDREAHDELHMQCPHVPLLGSYALRSVASLFRPGRDTLDSIDLLLLAIEGGTRHPRAHLIERQLAELSIHAIESQVPILKDALPLQQNATVIDIAPRHLHVVK